MTDSDFGSGQERSIGRRPRWPGLLTALVVVVAAGIFLWTQLPSGGYPTDLSRIGEGRPTLVLVYDHFYVGGGVVMEHMNAIRADQNHEIDFLVADMSADSGQAFAERYEVNDGTVLLFAGDGTHVGTLHGPDQNEIRRAIDDSFGL